MDLLECLARNSVKSVDKIPFVKSDEALLKEWLEDLLFRIDGVHFIDEEAGAMRRMDVSIAVKVESSFDKRTKQRKRLFQVNRTCVVAEWDDAFEDCWVEKEAYNAVASMLDTIDECRFFKKHGIASDGRYWRNEKMEQVLVIDGRVEVVK